MLSLNVLMPRFGTLKLAQLDTSIPIWTEEFQEFGGGRSWSGQSTVSEFVDWRSRLGLFFGLGRDEPPNRLHFVRIRHAYWSSENGNFA